MTVDVLEDVVEPDDDALQGMEGPRLVELPVFIPRVLGMSSVLSDIEVSDNVEERWLRFMSVKGCCCCRREGRVGLPSSSASCRLPRFDPFARDLRKLGSRRLGFARLRDTEADTSADDESEEECCPSRDEFPNILKVMLSSVFSLSSSHSLSEPAMSEGDEPLLGSRRAGIDATPLELAIEGMVLSRIPFCCGLADATASAGCGCLELEYP